MEHVSGRVKTAKVKLFLVADFVKFSNLIGGELEPVNIVVFFRVGVNLGRIRSSSGRNHAVLLKHPAQADLRGGHLVPAGNSFKIHSGADSIVTHFAASAVTVLSVNGQPFIA